MGKAYIVTPKLSDICTLSASNAVGGASAKNLQTARPRLFWRSTTTTPYLQGDFGYSPTVDTLVLGFVNAAGVSNLSAPDMFRLRMASTAVKLTDGTAEYDSGYQNILPDYLSLAAYAKVHRAFTFPSVALTFFRIDFDFSVNPAGYVQMGRLVLGARVAPVTSVKSGWTAGLDEPVAEVVDLGGEESPRTMGARATLAATWHDLTTSEKERLYSTMLERGSSRDLALVIDDASAQYYMSQIAIGRVKSAVEFPQTLFDGYEKHFSLALRVSQMAPSEMA